MSRPLLRAIGLDLLNSFSPFSFRPKPAFAEPTKCAIEASLWTSLFRCSVHILPSIGSLILLILNLQGYFIGSELAGVSNQDSVKLGAIQIAAKVQELLIISSLATTVFHVVVQELLTGDGVPLGLISCGIDFSRLSFYWSPAFWGGMKCKDAWKKWPLVTLLLLAGLIALTAGPSSAVLMVPSQQAWSGGWTQFFLNGTGEDLWPTVLAKDHTGSDTCKDAEAAVSDPSCIAGEFLALKQWSSTLGFVPGNVKIGPLFHIKALDGLILGYIRQSRGLEMYKETWAQATHSATAVVQEQLRGAWQVGIHRIGGTYGRLRYGNDSVSTVEVQIPAVRVICSPMARLAPSDTSLLFPVLPEYNHWANLSDDGTLIPAPTRAAQLEKPFSEIWKALDADSDPDLVKASWYPLTSEWGSVTAGLMFFDSPNAAADTTDTARLGMGCSVDARWAQGNSIITRGTIGGDFDKSSSVSHQRPETAFQEFGPIQDGSYRRIDASLEWLHALTPKISLPDQTGGRSKSANTLEIIIRASGLSRLDNSSSRASTICAASLEHLVSVVVANGISKVGLFRQSRMQEFNQLAENYTYATVAGHGDGVLNPKLSPLGQENTFTTMKMSQTTQGYALAMTSFLDYLAVMIIGAHLLIAFTHTFVLLWTRQSSGAWDTIPELLALSQNSEPAPKALQNTCAGISGASTYAERARIVATDGSSGSYAQHLELVFESDRSRTGKMSRKVDVGVLYGHCA
jgi:hypothetical protein